MVVVDKELDGVDKPILVQLEVLEKILFLNEKLVSVLKVLESDAIDNWYVGAGVINQTVFNYYHGYPIDYGIKDFDLVYYDLDLSYEAEDVVIKRIEEKCKKFDVKLDIKNEARVHLWYNEKYGVQKKPYRSVEDAIASWGATVTCIGVRLENGKLIVYAPYGLNDLFRMVIRPVKRDFSKEAYDERANRWLAKWPKLEKIEW